jgi:hypothetical protein
MKMKDCKTLTDLTYDQLVNLRRMCTADYPGAKLPQHSMPSSPCYSGQPAKRDRRHGRKHLERLGCTLEDVETAIAKANGQSILGNMIEAQRDWEVLPKAVRDEAEQQLDDYDYED